MVNTAKIILVCAGIAMIAVPSLYYQRRFSHEQTLNVDLREQLSQEQGLSVQLRGLLDEAVREQEQQQQLLNQLGDSQSLREAFLNAQKMATQLNRDLAAMDAERMNLRNTNNAFATRLENTGRELTRAVEELKTARQEISRLQGGGAVNLKKDLDELARSARLKDEEIARLKGDVRKLNAQLSSESASLEQKLEKLQQEKNALETAAARVGQQITSSGTPLAKLQETVNRLTETVSGKEEQIKTLEGQIDSLQAELAGSQPKSKTAQQKIITKLESANKDLERRLVSLEDELSLTRNEADALRNRKDTLAAERRLYESAREQVTRLTEMLVKKESEVDAARRESLEAKEKVISLQAQIARLEKDLSGSRDTAIRTRELEMQKISLSAQLQELQVALNKKSELVDSLQQNVDYLTQQINQREEKMQTISSQFAKTDTSTKEEIQKQKQRYEEVAMLYNSLKTQLAQSTDMLRQKETDLEQKRRENSAVREEIVQLKLRHDTLEKELEEVKQQYRKTLDDLMAAVKFNSLLQDQARSGLMPPDVSAGSKGALQEKEKADELKRRIEVILEPEP